MIDRRNRGASRLNVAHGGLVTVCILAGLAAGCTPHAAGGSAGGETAAIGEAGYLTQPVIEAAQRLSDGVLLTGRADPEARVRLASPDGVAYGATTGNGGAWTADAPAETSVRLFGLSEVIGERDIQGGGYIAVLPAPGRPAALLKAGGGSTALDGGQGALQGRPLQVTTVDFDGGGGAVVTGLAGGGAQVRLTLDGGAGGEGRSDGEGRFSIPLPGMLKSGDHEVVAQSGSGTARVAFAIAPASQALTNPPYRGERWAGGWRIDWLTPGGAPQTTLVFDPAAVAGGGAS